MADVSQLSKRLADWTKEGERLREAIAKATGASAAENELQPVDEFKLDQQRRSRNEVSVTSPISHRVESAMLPNGEEIASLFKIVCAAQPRLVADRGADESEGEWKARLLDGFHAAFIAVSMMGKQRKPDLSRPVYVWVDHAEQMLKQLGVVYRSEDMRRSFMLAVLASGAVPYTALWSRFSVSLGFVEWGSWHGDREAWRRVLETGQILRPTFPDEHRLPPPSPARVIEL